MLNTVNRASPTAGINISVACFPSSDCQMFKAIFFSFKRTMPMPDAFGDVNPIADFKPDFGLPILLDETCSLGDIQHLLTILMKVPFGVTPILKLH